MGKTIAYLRASTDRQDLNNQKLEILEFAREKNLHVDEFVAITISSRRWWAEVETGRVFRGWKPLAEVIGKSPVSSSMNGRCAEPPPHAGGASPPRTAAGYRQRPFPIGSGTPPTLEPQEESR